MGDNVQGFAELKIEPPNPCHPLRPTAGILVGAVGTVALSVTQVIPGDAAPVPAAGLAPLAPPGCWSWGTWGEGAQGGCWGGACGDGAQRVRGGRAGSAGEWL